MADDLQKALEENLEAVKAIVGSQDTVQKNTSTLIQVGEELLKKLDNLLAEKNIRIEEVSDAVIISNKTGLIVVSNVHAEELFGYSKGELLGKPLTSLMPERFREPHLSKQEAYFKAPSARYFRGLVGLKKDGTEFPVSIALQPLKSMGTGYLIMAILRSE